jgi:hypothetical protein
VSSPWFSLVSFCTSKLNFICGRSHRKFGWNIVNFWWCQIILVIWSVQLIPGAFGKKQLVEYSLGHSIMNYFCQWSVIFALFLFHRLVYWTWNWFHWQIKENFDEFKSILFSENARKFKYLYFYNFISFDGHARRSLWYIYYYIISMVIAITYEREIISLSETIRNGVDYFFFIIYLFFIHQYFIVWCYLWRYCEWLVIYFYEKVSDQLEDFKFCE